METGKWIFFCFIVAVVSINGVCFASDEGDLQYWSTVGGSFDINRQWRVDFEEEFRMGDKAGNLYYQHTDVGFVYKGLTDRIDLGFNYRQIFEDDSKGEQRREDRPHLNFTLKGKLSGISISDRSRFEFRCREKKEDVWRYRNKITFKLPFELTALKLKPYFADELFFDLDKKGYNRNRLYGGVSFGLTKSIKGEVYYLWQSSRSGSGRENINVIGTKLKFYF